MKITVQNSMADWLAFQTYFFDHSKHLRKQRMILRLIFILIFLFIAVTTTVMHGFNILILSAMTMALIVWLIIQNRLFRKSMLKQARKTLESGQNRQLNIDMSVELTEEQMNLKSSLSQSSYKWELVEKVVIYSGYIFIFLDPVKAIVIPGRYFESDEAFKEFYHTAKEYKGKQTV